jgi:DNA topoisomerase-1
MGADKGRKGAIPANSDKARNEKGFTLVIIESPAKRKKLEKILGPDYVVLASFGHIRDLPREGLGVEPPSFKPQYKITKVDAVKTLGNQIARAGRVILATDPDREGEAIAWHLKEVLKPEVPTYRMTFNAITESAVKSALGQLRDLDMGLVSAQETRRVLDRLVGFRISSILQKAFLDWHLSAGRVQTVALRMVVERQESIDIFKPKEYWELKANLRAKNGEFSARLIDWLGQPVDSSSFADKVSIERVVLSTQKQAWKVDDLQESPKVRSPKAPFITSTLQQAASSHLNFSPEITMGIAQKLYEAGMVTYMRTDSPAVAPEAAAEAALWIREAFGDEYAPKSSRSFQAKGDAQEAHECIRPTDISMRELDGADDITAEMAKLYSLIWQRFTASQMADAIDDETRIRIRVSDAVFEALGRVQRFDGWRRVYSFGDDEDGQNDEANEVLGKLPKVQVAEGLQLLSLEPQKKQTKAPKAYTEASLVRALEKEGVGRPSTFASIIGTLKERKYVEMSKKTIVPNSLGVQVCNFLKAQFPQLFDVKFTASMEKELDQIAIGKNSYGAFMKVFWGELSVWTDAADKVVADLKAEREANSPKCPKCGKALVKRKSKNGTFIGCTGYPDCRHTENLGSAVS